jgi:hypothetical protein
VASGAETPTDGCRAALGRVGDDLVRFSPGTGMGPVVRGHNVLAGMPSRGERRSERAPCERLRGSDRRGKPSSHYAIIVSERDEDSPSVLPSTEPGGEGNQATGTWLPVRRDPCSLPLRTSGSGKELCRAYAIQGDDRYFRDRRCLVRGMPHVGRHRRGEAAHHL